MSVDLICNIGLVRAALQVELRAILNAIIYDDRCCWLQKGTMLYFKIYNRFLFQKMKCISRTHELHTYTHTHNIAIQQFENGKIENIKVVALQAFS